MKKLLTLILCVISISCFAAPPMSYGPFDPGAIRTGGLAKTATGTAATPAYSFSSDPDTGIYSAGANILGFGVGGADVASLSSTGLSLSSPLAIVNGGTGATTAATGLAALGGASLNGSSTVDFSMKNGEVGGTFGVIGHSNLNTASFTGSVDLAVGEDGMIRTRSVTLADDAEVSLTTLFGKSLSCANLFTVTSTNAVGAFIIVYTSGSANAVTLVSGLNHSITNEDAKLCIYSAGSGVYNLKNRLGATVSFVVNANGFK